METKITEFTLKCALIENTILKIKLQKIHNHSSYLIPLYQQGYIKDWYFYLAANCPGAHQVQGW